jgi:FHA domain-containing protein
VLVQMLGKKMRGFMPPDEAMQDAFNDLSAHELGVIAGTRAALDEVLTKFDPAILGERLVRGSLLEKALPAIRKTKLWDLYLERYALMRREVEDDFQSVFGKAFVAAYEVETARMKARSASRRS